MSSIAVELEGASKHYGAVEALRPTSLRIENGCYFVLLGPSGGGKTTMLRLIGGLARPTAGRVRIAGVDVTDLPANRRSTSMVFQSYALFPHMNVATNVGYGLRLRKLPRDVIADKVHAMLALVGLDGFDERMPHELSGGQQQRVQLAQSLVLETRIILLDEPLAALDAKLRKSMCLELKHIQERVGITFVHVTHNQEEAMTIADRIGLVAGGELVEEGSAEAVYERPIRRFTADFIGESTLLDGTVSSVTDGQVELDLGFATVAVPRVGQSATVGASATVSVRSEDATIGLTPAGEEHQSLPVTFSEAVYLGITTTAIAMLPDGQDVQSRTLARLAPAMLEKGMNTSWSWPTAAGRLHLR